MAEATRPSPVKLVLGAIFSSEGIFIKAKKCLEKKFGPADFESPPIEFTFTRYYEKEMGVNLKRRFLSFGRLINPRHLAAIKLYTNRLERRLSPAAEFRGRRAINLDPGYICGGKLVLASCKDYSHRIYLDKGVYAEVTLHFRGKSFTAWPWTYPDYRSKAYLKVLNEIRGIYLKQQRIQGC